MGHEVYPNNKAVCFYMVVIKTNLPDTCNPLSKFILCDTELNGTICSLNVKMNIMNVCLALELLVIITTVLT